MPNRFNKILSSCLTCSLASSLVVGAGSSQVFAAFSEYAIEEFVNLLNNHREKYDALVEHMESMGPDEYYSFFIRARKRSSAKLSKALDVILYDFSAGENPLIPRVLQKIDGEQLQDIISGMHEYDIMAFLSSLRKCGAMNRFIELYGKGNFRMLVNGSLTRVVALNGREYDRAFKSFSAAAKSVNSKIGERKYDTCVSSFSESSWEDILTKAFSFQEIKDKQDELIQTIAGKSHEILGLRKDLEDEKKKVSDLEDRLSNAKSAKFYTAIFSILGTWASFFLLGWLFENRSDSKK